MLNYYQFVGHYKNIISQELCNAIIEEDFNYNESTYSTHEGQSPDWKKIKELKWMRYGFVKTMFFMRH